MKQGGRYPQVIFGLIGLIVSGSALWTLLTQYYSANVLVFGIGIASGGVLLVWVGAKRYRIPKPVWWSTLPSTVVLLLLSLGYTHRRRCCESAYTYESGYPDGYWNRFATSGTKEAVDTASVQIDPFALIVDLIFWWYLLVFGTISAVMIYRAGKNRRVPERHVTSPR